MYQNTVDTASDKNLVTLSKTTCSVTGGDDFKNELDGIMKVEGTKLTSKKYADKTITFKVNSKGQVSYSEGTTTE